MSDITNEAPHLAINNLKPGVDYKFRLTPVLRGTSSSADDATSSQLSLVLDVKMPSTRKGKCLFTLLFDQSSDLMFYLFSG